MTKRELQEWCEQVRAWGPLHDPEELAEALLALSQPDREEVLAQLPEELRGTVRTAVAQMEPASAEQPARRAKGRRRPTRVVGMAEGSTAQWKRCTECGFYGTEIVLTRKGAVPGDTMQLCPNCRAPLRNVAPREVFGSLPRERQEAIIDALAEGIAHCILKNRLPDGAG